MNLKNMRTSFGELELLQGRTGAGFRCGALRALVAGLAVAAAGCSMFQSAPPAPPAPAAKAPSVQVRPAGAPRAWADEVLYFVMIDRFADGDAGNNAGVDRRNPGGWHGGDLKGLTQQLGELQDLGVTALWINPVQMQQKRGVSASAKGIPDFTHEGFHGYWIHDFEAMEPHFGSEADLKNLVDAAH
ncbi:MAG TPA: alpha-amylase family glycosyl hydrolase, partial [Albitalea sp.]|nr:alpha-amylase family glycosyl hydrolase [Albitalea sp.]